MLHSVSATYGKLPSEVLGLEPGSWESYQLDVATLQLGRWIEGKLSERDEKGKPVYRLSDLLAGREFAPLAGGKNLKRMKIPDSGVW